MLGWVRREPTEEMAVWEGNREAEGRSTVGRRWYEGGGGEEWKMWSMVKGRAKGERVDDEEGFCGKGGGGGGGGGGEGRRLR